MIAKLSAQFPLALLCSTLGAGRSSYYAWRSRKPSRRQSENSQLLGQIREAHREGRGSYGSPRVAKALRGAGRPCGENRVARLMRKNGLRGSQKSRFRPKTTVADAKSAPSPNLLKERPAPAPTRFGFPTSPTSAPAKAGPISPPSWTSIPAPFAAGPWDMGQSLSTELVVKALKSAVARRSPSPGLLFHSDRGCQYTSAEFRSLLTLFKFEQSMSAKGYCYDNAAMESFWSTLKSECASSVFQGDETTLRHPTCTTFSSPCQKSLIFRSPRRFATMAPNSFSDTASSSLPASV